MKNFRDIGLESYALALGKIVSNLHGLELLLRVFLHNADKKRYRSPPPEVDPDKIKVAADVAENYFTNYDSLGDLIKRYNGLVAGLKAPELRIDETLVRLRDALAHGRVLGSKPEPPLRLYKFGKPTNNQVPVIDIIDLTDARLKKEISRVFGESMKVKKACEHFCPSAVG